MCTNDLIQGFALYTGILPFSKCRYATKIVEMIDEAIEKIVETFKMIDTTIKTTTSAITATKGENSTSRILLNKTSDSYMKR